MDKLYVVSVHSNPRRFASRTRLMNEYIHRMMKNDDIQLVIIECAFGNRDWEIKPRDGMTLIQCRSHEELWNKENLINYAVSRLPDDWKYIAWIDADIEFVRPNWASESIHMLQHYPFIQPWTHALNLGPHYQSVGISVDGKREANKLDVSFAYQFCTKEEFPDRHIDYAFWHCGYAWAARRDAWELSGGLLDRAICGAGDHHMATALIGEVDKSIHGGMTDAYKKMCRTWQSHVRKHHRQLGYVLGSILHHWHGNRSNRQYVKRWDILKNNEYDPYVDVTKCSHGLLKFTDTKPKLRRALGYYFNQRDDDANSV